MVSSSIQAARPLARQLLTSSQPSRIAATSTRALHSQAQPRRRPPIASQTRQQSGWAAAVNAAQSVLSHPPPFVGSSSPASQSSSPPPPPTASAFDPIAMVADDLGSLRSNIMALLGSGHPSLDSVAKYYFQAEGKHIRPLIVLLMSAATNGISPIYGSGRTAEGEKDLTGIDEPLSPKSILNDYNPSLGDQTIPSSSSANILPTQRRLAEISEMIHVASLLHDDVIDESALRRGAPSSPSTFGNKLSILGGDFLLGRASVALARLRDNEVVELLATVISNLVEGEVMQMKGVDVGALEGSGLSSFWTAADNASTSSAAASASTSKAELPGPTPEHFTSYLQKTYLKTASLMAKSSRAAAILGGHGEAALAQWRANRGANVDAHEAEAILARSAAIRDAAYSYGRNLGIAFQLVDDLLDFKSSSASFGKPSLGADLRLGLATAPVLYAWQEFPGKAERMKEMVERKFEAEGDVERTMDIVHRSQGLMKTAQLATHHAQEASKALEAIPDGEAKVALQRLVTGVLERVK